MIMPDYLLEYQSVSESEEKMLDDVTGILAAHNIEGELRQAFILTVSEAFTNALTHGNNYDTDKLIKISIYINHNSLTADIIDEGKGGLKKVFEKSPPTLLSEHGRGVDLMRYYSSAVRFRKTSIGGLRVTVVFEMKKNEVT